MEYTNRKNKKKGLSIYQQSFFVCPLFLAEQVLWLCSVLPEQGPVDSCPPLFVHVEVCLAEARFIKDGVTAIAANAATMTIAIVNVCIFIVKNLMGNKL